MSFQVRVKQNMQDLDNRLAAFPQLNSLEKNFGVSKLYVFLTAAGIYALFLFLNWGGFLLTNLLAFAMPAFFSINAIETTNKADDTQWLTYYLVTSFLNVIEYWSQLILYYVPVYWLLKAIFLIWLALPKFNGATIIYRHLIRPYITPHVIRICKSVSRQNAAPAPTASSFAHTTATDIPPSI
ncbi:Protein yop1 [Schizosaccharomyces pombe]|uniref:Protein yop1 n=1 Tax=Schizosaccharomyces pombe (strain 972 / ATCC 24843) TaxID=284812 RepID=YOP1_SCHPO|nr:ER membrane protein DP1/Yop1 [Schizosaccharomyces pombe]Q9UU91.1 RecName: Full=Protein yop1 [Schizosaccharomyces pombe 972h-]CAB52881.1 ER membrane protein DP1/Yop1 [Schizosaccharomyces pombe]|eukprot:NP_588478.1 ER membrane protein DP1/Yop1 [Schizosaccharomyces pombe]